MELRDSISLTSDLGRPTVTSVAIDIRVRPAEVARAQTLWRSSIGKKSVMAVTGLIMVLFLLVHMLGNLKILDRKSVV